MNESREAGYNLRNGDREFDRNHAAVSGNIDDVIVPRRKRDSAEESCVWVAKCEAYLLG